MQDQQGQALPEVPEEADRPAREGQEEEGGDVQRPPGDEEGRQVDMLCPLSIPSCCVEPLSINKSFRVEFWVFAVLVQYEYRATIWILDVGLVNFWDVPQPAWAVGS